MIPEQEVETTTMTTVLEKGELVEKEVTIKVTIDEILKIGVRLKDRMKLGVPNSSTISSLLVENTAQCSDYVLLFTTVLNEFGIPTRKINMYNYPNWGDGHSTCEFYFKKKWRYYDPSYNFFVSTFDTM